MNTEIVLKKLYTDNMDKIRSTNDVMKFAKDFQDIMGYYDCAIKELKTRFEILESEFEIKGERKSISVIESRIKDPQSIVEKMFRKNLPITIESMMKNLYDIAGVRIVCPFISDVYHVRLMLENQSGIEILEVKDYIKNPKKSGYRSMHVIVNVSVNFSETKQHIPVEIQIRTSAMDFWASLEHQLHYKKDYVMPKNVEEELKAIANSSAENDMRMQEIAKNLPNFVDYSNYFSSDEDLKIAIDENELDITDEELYEDYEIK